MGYWTSLNLNVIILAVSFQQNLNFKIQMLAGKSLILFLNSGSEENSTLGIYLWSEAKINTLMRSKGAFTMKFLLYCFSNFGPLCIRPILHKRLRNTNFDSLISRTAKVLQGFF